MAPHLFGVFSDREVFSVVSKDLISRSQNTILCLQGLNLFLDFLDSHLRRHNSDKFEGKHTSVLLALGREDKTLGGGSGGCLCSINH